MDSTADRLELTVTLTANDVFHGMALTWRRLAVVVTILSLAIATLIVLDRKEPSRELSAVTAAVLAVVVAFRPAYIGMIYQGSRKAFYNRRVYETALNYVFTEKDFAVTGPMFNAETAWSNVCQVRESKSLFILLPRITSEMTVLPKRCFRATSALEAFRGLLRSHVSGRVKLLSANPGSSK